jgi:hypothetical protein
MVCQCLGRALAASLDAVIGCAGPPCSFRATRLHPPAPSAPYQPGLSAQIQPIQVPSPTASSPVPAREILNKYCVTCRNQRLNTRSGVMFEATVSTPWRFLERDRAGPKVPPDTFR